MALAGLSMISLITCSHQQARFDAVKQMYDRAMAGVEWEMIRIADAKSLAEGYNRGVAQSRGDIVIFSHDDVEVLNPEFPQRIARHLEKFDLIGVAGTTRIVGPAWFLAAYPYIFGQVAHPGDTTPWSVAVYNAPRPIVGEIQALDGLVMAARREMLSRIRFDEVTFDGWHHYDVDFSYAAYCAGFRVGVACDIAMLHQSTGRFSADWQTYAERFRRKWMPDLPNPPMPTLIWTNVYVATRADCLQIMNPPFWLDE
jgi:GT2 family glycosyltransferase